MKFVDVLPHLEAGRVATRSNGVRYKLEGGVLVGMGSTVAYTFRAGDGYLLARDWELVVEEPAPAKADDEWCQFCRGAASRLERNLSVSDTQAKLQASECQRLTVEVARLTRERDEARNWCAADGGQDAGYCRLPAGHGGAWHVNSTRVWPK